MQNDAAGNNVLYRGANQVNNREKVTDMKNKKNSSGIKKGKAIEVDQKTLNAVDEDIILSVSRDNLMAYVRFKPPKNGGKLLNEADIRNYLDNKGIVYGLDETMLNFLFNERNYREKYLIAQGIPVVRGTDGYLIYLFDLGKKKVKPKINEDGTADHHSLDLYEMAEPGQVLIKAVKGTPGKNGINIYGRPILCKNGKPAPKISIGKNIAYFEDELEYRAVIPGQIVFKNRRLSITEIIEIHEDVGPGTGDIDFPGTVRVFGNVLTDFQIKAEGNVEVFGIIEGAQIKAKGSVIVNRGILGVGKAQIEAADNISAKFIMDATIFAGGDINAESIVRCDISCMRSLKLKGKKGLLMGGSAIVGRDVYANTIGSPMSTKTEVCVGINPNTYHKYHQTQVKLRKLKKEYEEIQKSLSSFYQFSENGKLRDDKKDHYMGLVSSRRFVKDNILILENTIKELLPELRKAGGFIKAGAVVYPGVKIQLGNAIMYVMDEIHRSTFVNESGIVIIQR